MTSHREIVAWGFCVAGGLVGLPSAVGLGLIGYDRFGARPSENTSEYLDIGKYGIAGLLHNGAKGVTDIFGWLGGIASWIEGVLAVVLAVALVFGIVLFFIGRGIARHAAGAGVAGIVLSVILLLAWSLILLSTSGSAMALPAIGMVMSFYTIWVLGWPRSY